ncbi:MAG: DNA polymerase III subunit chi [Cypionkella sp.]|nr:DNA polymerase III subunit chi [Cypionkella sp.]
MGRVMFYHLTRSGVEETLRLLLDRALAQGWRIMIRSPVAERLDRLDARLWQEPEEGFLPHGREGGAEDAVQPVLLGMGAAVNGAQGLMLLDGAEVSEAEARAMERVWIIFDGADGAQLSAARGLWKRLVEAGLHAQYWSEESGRWQMMQEKGA